MSDLRRRLLAEGLGTALLLVLVVGSGIAVEQLGQDGIAQLFAHAVVVGAGLAALIVMFAPVSGAHFNPAVTLGFFREGAIGPRVSVAYVAVQVAGGTAGVALANWSFGLPLIELGTRQRLTSGTFGAEFVATFVLVLLILGLVRNRNFAAVAPAVGAWVAAAIVATSSTGFANPAVTIGRTFTDSYTGIAPGSIAGFMAAQFAAAFAAAAVAKLVFPSKAPAVVATTIGGKLNE